MHRLRVSVLGSLGLLLVTACHGPSEQALRANTVALDRCTAALEAHEAREPQDDGGLRQGAPPPSPADQDVEPAEAQALALRASRQLIPPPADELASEREPAASTSITFVESPGSGREREDLLELIVTFLALIFAVVAIGNSSRTSCEDLLLQEPRSTEHEEALDHAIKGRARDFVNTYRWSLRSLVGVALYLWFFATEERGTSRQVICLAGIGLSACVLYAFLRSESETLERISAGRLKLPRGFCRLFFTWRGAELGARPPRILSGTAPASPSTAPPPTAVPPPLPAPPPARPDAAASGPSPDPAP